MVISSINCSCRTYKYSYITTGPLLVVNLPDTNMKHHMVLAGLPLGFHVTLEDGRVLYVK